MQTNVSIAFG